MTLETALNGKPVTEEVVANDEQKLEARVDELSKKSDITDDEKKELDELKQGKQTRYQKRIDTLTYKAKLAEEESEKKSREVEEWRKRAEEAEKKISDKPPKIKQDVLKIGEKNFFTDEALASMIQAGEMNEQEAIRHQQDRIQEMAAERAYQRIKEEQIKETQVNTRRQDAEDVLKQYPHFNKNHQDFNPNDPLYKLTNELYEEGYAANPRGLSLAIKRAKEILRLDSTQVDRTDDLNLVNSPAPKRTSGGQKEITLTDAEKSAATRIWTNQTNPRTGRSYTENEAIMKATEAKKRRNE